MTILTEQWKKGELNRNKVYYYETPFHTTDTASGYWLCNHLDTKKDKIEILGEVPSFEKWQQLKKWCEEFNALDVAKENAQLKELLKEWLLFEKEENPHDFTIMSERMEELAKQSKELLGEE